MRLTRRQPKATMAFSVPPERVALFVSRALAAHERPRALSTVRALIAAQAVDSRPVSISPMWTVVRSNHGLIVFTAQVGGLNAAARAALSEAGEAVAVHITEYPYLSRPS